MDGNNGRYRCEKCQREFPNFKWRLVLAINITDASNETKWITFSFAMYCKHDIGEPFATGTTTSNPFEEGDEPTEHSNPNVGQETTTKPKLARASVKRHPRQRVSTPQTLMLKRRNKS